LDAFFTHHGGLTSSAPIQHRHAVYLYILSLQTGFNGSDDLSRLTVADIQDKVYADDNHKPLWVLNKQM
jgi:hypothetical protein